MPFLNDDPRINRQGRPPGSSEKAVIGIRAQKKLLQLLTDRALDGDHAAQESLALLIVSQNREAIHAD